MTMMFEYRSVTPVRVMPPKPFKALERPALSFAEQAKRDNRAVLASWDRTAPKFSGNKEAIIARRVEWVEALPTGPLDRNTIRAAWGITDGAADSRIDRLERDGLLKRLPVRPYQWERAE